jgi:hypothetical protein
MAAAKLRHLFNFHLLFYYKAEAPSSTFNPRCQLQLQSSSPTSSLVAFNFNPRCQLRASSPTSTLVAFNFNHRRLSISRPRRLNLQFPPLLFDARNVLDAAAAR